MYSASLAKELNKRHRLSDRHGVCVCVCVCVCVGARHISTSETTLQLSLYLVGYELYRRGWKSATIIHGVLLSRTVEL